VARDTFDEEPIRMSDAPKSAWEIALEKLQQKEIASVRQRSQAKMAEAEILHDDQRRKALQDPEALAKVEEEYRIERRRIEDARERDIERVRSGKKPPATAATKPAGKPKKRR
jgi:serine phosphatase RsbU (regulator of sigma subunit)